MLSRDAAVEMPELMASELGWDAGRVAEEVECFREETALRDVEVTAP
jgi:hypothetical protein